MQLKLEKVLATQQYIEEFKKQRAEWRRLEQEKNDAENQRIREFSNYQRQTEETRAARMQEREQAKQHILQMVRQRSADGPKGWSDVTLMAPNVNTLCLLS